jgi:hypothetical protein
MTKARILIVTAALASFLGTVGVVNAQEGAMAGSPPLNGVFVTPVPGAPFSAMVEQDMTQVLKDGSPFQRKTAAFIARDSQGRIHNEGRDIIPSSSSQKPTLFVTHIYDPETRLNTLLNPYTHIARQRVLPNPPPTEPITNWGLQQPAGRPPNPNLQVQDLGPSVMEGLDVHGYRRIQTIPDKASGTGRPVVVTDEFWYSQELHLNILTKHNDPRTGSLILTISQINVNEPDVELFTIPPEYKIVDMTPPDQESQKPAPVVQ